MKKRKIVIIGCNHAGTAVANYLTEHDKNKENIEIVIYDSNNNISFLGCGIALWVSKVIDNPSGLFYSSPEILTKKGCHIKMNHQLVDVDFNKKTIMIESTITKKQFADNYDDLVLAVGSWPVNLPLKNIDAKNILQVKLYQHAQQIVKKARGNDCKRVAVIGAGYIGIELAEAFRKFNKDVVLIDMGKSVLCGYYDKEFCALMEKKMQEHNVKLAMNECITGFEKNEKGEVSAVITNKNKYQVDLVLLSVGVRPQTSLFAKTDLKLLKNGAIVVDKHQQTNIPHVYAVGDCSSTYNNALQCESYISLASNALRTGLIAGSSLLNDHQLVNHGSQAASAIHVYGLTLTGVGISYANAKKLGIKAKISKIVDNQKPEFMPNKENFKVLLQLVYEEKTHRLLGAQIAAEHDISALIHTFSLAIQQEMTIEQLRMLDIMFLPHFNKPYNYIMNALMQTN